MLKALPGMLELLSLTHLAIDSIPIRAILDPMHLKVIGNSAKVFADAMSAPSIVLGIAAWRNTVSCLFVARGWSRCFPHALAPVVAGGVRHSQEWAGQMRLTYGRGCRWNRVGGVTRNAPIRDCCIDTVTMAP